MGVPVIEFHLDSRSGVAPYQQIVGQVRQALLLGLLAEGDKLPTVKEVVAVLAINPNTVSKAYRELEHLGLAAAKPGVGTFITRSLGQASLADHAPLQDELRDWLAKARAAGLTEPGIEALIQRTFREGGDQGTREEGHAGGDQRAREESHASSRGDGNEQHHAGTHEPTHDGDETPNTSEQRTSKAPEGTRRK